MKFYVTTVMSVMVETQPVAVRRRPASSAALSTMNHQSTSTSSSSASNHWAVLANKVLSLFRSQSDSSMPRPPSPPRRRPAGPPRSASATSPSTASTGQQQQVKQRHHHGRGGRRTQSTGGTGQQRRRYQRVVRNENAPPPDQPDDNPYVVRKFTQEYLANYYADKHPKPPTGKSAPCLSSSPTGSLPGHTILKKSLDNTLSGSVGNTADAELGHSPSLPNRHAKFRDVVEIVEFGERDQVKTGVHFAHEEQLHDDDDGDDDNVGEFDDDDDQVLSVTTPSECSSISDDPVLFFSQDDDDKISTTRSLSSSGGNTPELGHVASPLLGNEDAGACSENVLKNIFTSLSGRNETSTSDDRQTTVKHVRLMDRVEPVERDGRYS